MKLTREQVAEIIESFRKVADILEVANANEGKDTAVEVDKKATKTAKASKEVVKEEVVADEPAETAVSREEELNALSFNELKSYAKELGVKATGTKAQILAKVLEAEEGLEDAPESSDDDVNESPVEIDDAEGDNDDNDDEPEAGEETLADQVARELEDSTDAELKKILADIGIKAIGKRQTLLDKIVKAIEEGKLDFGDEDGDDTDDADAEVIPGSEERHEAMASLKEEILENYENGEITDKEIASFLKDYYDGKAPKATKEEKLEDFIRINANLIDDEGEQHDFQDPYYVGDDVFCCGSHTKKLDDGNFYCEICGETYQD